MQTDIALATHAWLIVIQDNISTYHDVISTVIENLIPVERYKQGFTPTSELHHNETLLQQLELKLDIFHRILPRLDRRRGLVNIESSILKSLFATATISDIY
jgi:hypothetical protein